MRKDMKIAIHFHIFYEDLYSQVAECIKNIDEPYDLFISYVNEGSFLKKIITDFPNAIVSKVPNKGFDVGPFIDFINHLDLNKYTHIIKLHTKRNVPYYDYQNNFPIYNNLWRELLLNFIRVPANWQRTKRCFYNSKVAMVADGRLILYKGKKNEYRIFQEAVTYAKKLSLHLNKYPLFVAGTMFMSRADIFKSIQNKYTIDDFDVVKSHGTSLAHIFERLLGFCACANGNTIVDFASTDNHL